MENNIEYRVFGLKFSMPTELIERQIMEMGAEEFIVYAKGFFDNPYWPCAYMWDRSFFKTEAEWQKNEIEGPGYRLIRKERGTKLYWSGSRLKCLQETTLLCSG